MKKLLLNSLLLFAISFGIQAQKTIYVDFGCNDVNNGNFTIGPDKNGNYWNNVTNTSGSSTALVDNKNAVTTMYINVTNGFSKNGILSGGLLAPDEAKLNDFAINTATYFNFGSFPYDDHLSNIQN